MGDRKQQLGYGRTVDVRKDVTYHLLGSPRIRPNLESILSHRRRPESLFHKPASLRVDVPLTLLHVGTEHVML